MCCLGSGDTRVSTRVTDWKYTLRKADPRTAPEETLVYGQMGYLRIVGSIGGTGERPVRIWRIFMLHGFEAAGTSAVLVAEQVAAEPMK